MVRLHNPIPQSLLSSGNINEAINNGTGEIPTNAQHPACPSFCWPIPRNNVWVGEAGVVGTITKPSLTATNAMGVIWEVLLR